MKKILLGFALTFTALSFAQQYPDNGWGNAGYSNTDGYYSDDGGDYFPDDYYYNYPQDYYPADYYQGYYNDYRNSIVNVNWNVFFNQNRLNRWQIDQIQHLNNLYSNFSAWNNFYRYNPDRWYYDRFYAMERILGPRLFVVFQNNFYQGYSPVVYFQNYRRTNYIPRYNVTPRYRNVNINIYKVDRNNFRRQDNPTLKLVRSSRESGFRNASNSAGSNNTGGFRNPDHAVKGNSGGFRNNNSKPQTHGGARPLSPAASSTSGGNGGFRNNTNSAAGTRPASPAVQSNGTRGNSGFRNNESGTAPAAPKAGNNGTRGGGFRS